MSISQEQLEEWKALAEKTTKGDWEVIERPGPSKKRQKPILFVECVLTEGYFAGLRAVIARANTPHDRDFIAASRTAVPSLIAEVERLRADLIEERTAVRELQRDACARDGVPMPSERPVVDKMRAEVERLREVVRGFLDCPEIADCAPDDKDPETDALERRARAALPEEPADD